MQAQRRTETERLLHVFDFNRAGKVSRVRAARSGVDTIAGWDEMQGYPETYGYGDTVGLSWGDVGHGLNVALNPVAQYHALQRAFGRGGGQPQMPPQMQQRPMMAAPQLPPNAVQAMQYGPKRLLAYMGLGSHTFNAGDTATFQFSAEPQAAFRGRRLVISQAKSTGAIQIAMTINEPLTVSGIPQTPAPNAPAPVEMFDASTTYSMLDLQIAQAATQITIGIGPSAAIPAANSVVVTAGLYGEWLR